MWALGAHAQCISVPRPRSLKTAGVTYQVDEAGGGEPDADEDAGELRQADAVAGAQQAQVLQDVGE